MGQAKQRKLAGTYPVQTPLRTVPQPFTVEMGHYDSDRTYTHHITFPNGHEPRNTEDAFMEYIYGAVVPCGLSVLGEGKHQPWIVVRDKQGKITMGTHVAKYSDVPTTVFDRVNAEIDHDEGAYRKM